MNEIVLGSFFGDEGKGQTVHNLCKTHPREETIVIRFSGGHQVGHTVRHGELEHTFSNYGSGTLLGIPTYWSKYCTVDPITTMEELADLNKMGVNPEIIYHPLCEVVTPFDVISQWNNKENLRHGTVGTGFKSALDRVAAGYHITVRDCANIMVLRTKIASLIKNYYDFSSTLPMYSIDDWCIKVHEYFKSVIVCDENILTRYDYRVFEGSQGILLDQTFGIMPYCTPSNTTCQNAMEIINRIKSVPKNHLGRMTEELTNHVYVIRPYITRHGNGPIPTSKPVRKVEDPNNKFNEFQRTLRAVEFDVELLQHSLLVDSTFYPRHYSHRKVLVITHKDEITSQFNDELLSGDWEEQFNSIQMSYYDKLIV